jgi:hypothetical protein
MDSTNNWITITEYLSQGNSLRDLRPEDGAKYIPTNNAISAIASSSREGYCKIAIESKCSCRSCTVLKKEVPTDHVIVKIYNNK